LARLSQQLSFELSILTITIVVVVILLLLLLLSPLIIPAFIIRRDHLIGYLL